MGVLGEDEDEPITYSPAVGSPVTVPGIFDEAFQRVDLGQPGVNSAGPAVFLTLVDLPSDPRVDKAATITFGGKVYLPHERQPDGVGGIVLHLHEVV